MVQVTNQFLAFKRNKYLQALNNLTAGHPLTADQLHLIYNYSGHLGSHFNAVVQLQKLFPSKSHLLNKVSFLSQHKPFSLTDVEQLLQVEPEGFQRWYSWEDFVKLRQQFGVSTTLSFAEMVKIFGNHTVTGAAFVPGGIPHIDFFVWGNAMGIVKYVEVTGEDALDANILVHFENKLDRTLEGYKRSYIEKLINQRRAQDKLVEVNHAHDHDNIIKDSTPLREAPRLTPILTPYGSRDTSNKIE